MPEAETIEVLLKPTQAAKILNVSRPYVYKMAERGVLPCVRIPNIDNPDRASVRFKQQDVFDFIERYYNGSTT